MDTKQYQQDYTKLLLSATGYSGNKEPGKKRISASSLSSDILPLYLDFKHGKSPEEKFGQSNLGSMYQLGVDTACQNNTQYESALRIEVELPNGWILSGEIDQIDHINKVIIDNKVSKTYALGKIKSEGKNHTYAIQLSVYRYLLWKKTGEIYECALAYVDKEATEISHKTTYNKNTLQYIEPELLSFEEVEALALEKSNELQGYIDIDAVPSKCKDLWPRKYKGKTIPSRCQFYCDYNKHCKHYNPKSKQEMLALSLEVQVPAEDKPFSAADIDTSDLNF